MKLAVQVCASLLVICAGFRFLTILIPVEPYRISLMWVAYPLTFVWLIGMTNAVNLIDGMDGFAGGISTIIAASFSVFFLIRGNIMAAVISLALAGATVGFLVFNLPPAKIFMGDSGSLFLGFMLGVLPILDRSSSSYSMNLVSLITLMAIPVLDVLSAILRRGRRGVSFMTADNEHIHHKLLGLGLSTRGALAVLFGLQVLLSVVGLSTLYFLEGAFYLNLAAWVIAVGFFVGVNFLWKRSEHRVPPRRASGELLGLERQG